MPRGVFIHTSKTIQPLVCSFAKYRMDVGCILHIGVGFGVARFRHSGLPEPLTVMRATVQGFTLEPKFKIYLFDNQILKCVDFMI